MEKTHGNAGRYRTPVDQDYALVLRARRTELKMTARDIRQRTGLSNDAVNAVFKGSMSARLVNIRAVARALGLTAEITLAAVPPAPEPGTNHEQGE